jgi:hypothetical protein
MTIAGFGQKGNWYCDAPWSAEVSSLRDMTNDVMRLPSVHAVHEATASPGAGRSRLAIGRSVRSQPVATRGDGFVVGSRQRSTSARVQSTMLSGRAK